LAGYIITLPIVDRIQQVTLVQPRKNQSHDPFLPHIHPFTLRWSFSHPTQYF